MYLEEAPVICQCSVGGPQSPCAYGLSLNPLGSLQPSAGSLTAQDTQRHVSSPVTKEVQISPIQGYRENTHASSWLKIPAPTLCTHTDVCKHAWTHTTSVFQSVTAWRGASEHTNSAHQRVIQYEWQLCQCTHFFPYLFLLPLLLLSLFFLPDLGEALLLALKLCF